MGNITSKGRKPPRSVDTYTPFWESDVKEMLGESCFFIDQEDGNGGRAKLMFTPLEVNRVYQPYTGTTMVEGTDYTVDLVNGYLNIVGGGSLIDLDREELKVIKDAENGDKFGSITSTSATQTDIYQDVLTIGVEYRIRGKGMGDGAAAPIVSQPGVQNIFVGTSGAAWQYFDATFTAATITRIHFGIPSASGAGRVVKFDDLILEDTSNPGVNLLVDGDMEAADFSAWSSTGSPTLAKANDIYNIDRVPSDNYARLTTTLAGDSSFYEDVLTTGVQHRAVGYARGDGTAAPVVSLPGEATLWTGTISTDNQKFDVTFTPSTVTQLHFGLLGAGGAGRQVEFDLLFCEKATDLGTNLLTDGNCDASDFSAWSSVNSPTLAKIAIPATGATNHFANIYSSDEVILQNYVEVDYTHAGTEWAARSGPTLTDNSAGLPLFFSKLYSQQSIKIAYMGDSIVVGASSSGNVGLPPSGKSWVEHFEDKLTNQYSATIVSQNFAVGGTGAAAGAGVAASVISYAPDIVFIGYGINDAGAFTTESIYKSDQEATVAALRAGLPNVEIVLVSPTVANPDWQNFGGRLSRYTGYLTALEEIQAANPTFCAVADPTSIWIEIFNMDATGGYTGKDYMAVQSNNANHPADWGHKVICQAVLSSLRIK